MISGLVMSTTLVNTGMAMLAGDSREHMSGSNLKDAGGPSINVLTKLTCMFALVETTEHVWTFFAIMVGTCLIALVGSNLNRIFCSKRKGISSTAPKSEE